MTLPQEIWTIVSSNLSCRRDLAALASVSLLHLHAVRSVLYRDFRIVNNGETDTISNQHLTFELLASDNGALARRVEHLEIFTALIDDLSVASTGNASPAGAASPPQPNPASRRRYLLIPPDVLRKMANLRSLSICGIWPFDSEEARAFVDILNALGVLEEISVDVTPFPDEGTVQFELKGLKRVRWFNSEFEGFANPFSSLILKSLLLASNSTITHLLFPSRIDDFEAEHVPAFETLHSLSTSFPNLTTLVLGPWVEVDSNAYEASCALMSFLLHHPSLRHIHFGWESKDPTDDYFPELNPGPFMTSSLSFLPHLQTLSANARPISVLIGNFPSILQSIERLRWGTGVEESLEEHISIMLWDLRSAIKQTGAPNLKRIDIAFGESNVVEIWGVSTDKDELGDSIDKYVWTATIKEVYDRVKTPRLEEMVLNDPYLPYSHILPEALGRYLPESVKVLRIRGVNKLRDHNESELIVSNMVHRIAHSKPNLIRIVLQQYSMSQNVENVGKGRKIRQLDEVIWPLNVVAFRVTRDKGDVKVSQCAIEESDVDDVDDIFDF